VAVHVRTDNDDGSKTFRWEGPDGSSGLGGLRTFELPLYGGEHLAARPGERVVVCEGEKAAGVLNAVGLLAVGTATGASGTPASEVLRPLIGRTVILWPDVDTPGRQHMMRVAERLRELGVEPRIAEWAEAPPGGDAADFVDENGAGVALDALLAAARPCGGGDGVLLADVAPQAVQWLWRGRVPLGKVTVLDGDPGLGKSLITLDVAARVTTGRLMPDGTRGDTPAPAGVVLLSAEDDLADTIRPRVDGAGGDAARVLALPTIRRDGVEAIPSVEDVDALRAAVRRIGARLVVVDPLMAYLPERRDSHRDQDVRRALAPLARFAAEEGVAIFVVRHLKKGEGGNPLHRGGGSIGIIGAARAGLLVAPDPDDAEGSRRVLVPTKMNLSAPAPALAYRVIAPEGVAIVEWLGTSAHTAEALLAARLPQEEQTELDEAAGFVRNILLDGPKPAGEVKAAAHQAGIAERTLARARARIRATTERVGFGPGAVYFWVLPPCSPPPCVPNPIPVQDGTHGEDGTHGVLTGFQPPPAPSDPHACQGFGVGTHEDGLPPLARKAQELFDATILRVSPAAGGRTPQ